MGKGQRFTEEFRVEAVSSDSVIRRAYRLKILKIIIHWLLMLFTLSAGAVLVEGYDISKSWGQAVVFVPSSSFAKTVTDVKTEKPMPVVILMHGCGGIGEHERRWARHISGEGFIVVLPDSFAIPNRKKNCDSSSHETNLKLTPVHTLRPAEATYALSKVKEQSWADQNLIFLMGHSEGGMAAYMTPELGFKGVIFSGFTCRIQGGVRAKSDVPVLALNWERDPWFAKPDRPYRTCRDTPLWQRRPDAQELILPGQGHATADEPSARDAVTNFLKRNM